MLHQSRRLLLVSILSLFCTTSLYAQPPAAFTLDSNGLTNGVELDKLAWRYHAGDDVGWADPRLDDGSWEVLGGTRLNADHLPREGWAGVGWFRLHLRVDPALAKEPLGLSMMQTAGASEIYLDGKLLQRFGMVSADESVEREFNPNSSPFGLVFGDGGEHVIAIRRSAAILRGASSGWLMRQGLGAGFTLTAESLDKAVADREAVLTIWTLRAGYASLFLALGLLYLMLFAFYPRQRASLFFSLYAFGIVAGIAVGYVFYVSHYAGEVRVVLNCVNLFVIAASFASLFAFLYTAFSARFPRQFWAFVAAEAVWVVLAVLLPGAGATVWLFSAILLFIIAEALRVMFYAVKERREGAWIVSAGLLLGLVGPVLQILRDFRVTVPQSIENTTDQAAVFGIVTSIAIYLARNFALTNKRLLQREQEKAKVEQELALAAEIQKGLFPESLPAIRGYEIAARNRPARQCGGDYYDVIALDEGGGDGAGRNSYLLCVADVAGKGLDASLLMSNMQATLRALAGRTPSLIELAAQINQRLHESSPPNKFVTAILLEIDAASGEAKYVNAGHSECLLLRHETGAFEPLESTGLPLGVMPDDMLRALGKQYEEMPLRVGPGDLLALFSDGVTEAHDEQEREWGEDQLEKCLAVAADETAQAIIERVFMEIDRFAGTAPQHDDITLLAFKKAPAVSGESVSTETAA